MANNTLTTLFRRSLITAGIITAAGCTTFSEGTSMTLTNTDKATALIESIETGDHAPIAYINADKYIQHNLAVADGLAGFGAVLKALPKGSAKAKVIRAFEDGNFAVTHTEYDFFGPKVGFDVFRFEEGKIVEHWDNLQEIAPINASGRSQLDGTTKMTDLAKTDQNKAIVEDFVQSILINGEMKKIEQFIGPNEDDYLQHNPSVSDGLKGLGEALGALAEQGMPMIYEKNHIILGQGNFVLAISEGQFLNQHVAFYDLFRLDNSMIVEHWDTIEVIQEKDQWKNNNGKFAF
ncbi:hypothetical protein QWZ04_11880 [Vibrio tapetis subsp. quintayensis]|uniref:nuclear transport factor 2 family protein n=1 Tax=Vibrio tapetis TaxID=52443 RepID=UPI0025B51ADE|nr:nuclear transport factor 2 family protein [Vibrio tapetis]MDN3681022.1 hypothetical protein [Vibrio tapetis subsp. quintayensis]